MELLVHRPSHSLPAEYLPIASQESGSHTAPQPTAAAPTPIKRPRATAFAILAAGIIAGFLALSLALSGPFLFDDYPNLGPLTNLSVAEAHFDDWLRVIFGNNSGPLGRPLSMLSFALQAEYWPENPAAFKIVNLLLHSCTALALGGIAWLIADLAGLRKEISPVVAAATAVIWHMHPIHLPTVMLVVQRMTILSSLGIALGLLFVLLATATQNRYRQLAYLWLGLPAAMSLAMFAKETAILLPIYIITLITTLAPMRDMLRQHRWWGGICVALPLIAFCAFIALRWPTYAATFELRAFTLEQRLLTETRVVMSYLGDIFLPGPASSDLYYDDIIVSRGWLQPVSTLWSGLALATVSCLAIAWRRRYPLLALGWLWFVGGHLLESTFLPLELRFQHRNYLPAFGPILAVVLTLAKISQARTLLIGLALASLLPLLTTASSARLWGDPLGLVSTWAMTQPNSARSQYTAAKVVFDLGDPDTAMSFVLRAREADPRDVGSELLELIIACETGRDISSTLDRLNTRHQNRSIGSIATQSFQYLRIGLRSDTFCPALELADLIEIAEHLYQGPIHQQTPGALAKMQDELAEIYIASGNLNGAMLAFDRSYELRPNPYTAIRQAQILASAGLPEDAQKFIELARRTPHPNHWVRLLGLVPTVQLQPENE